MTEHGKGVRVTNCPIKQEYCYPSCYWRKGDKCYFQRDKPYFQSRRGRRIKEEKGDITIPKRD